MKNICKANMIDRFMRNGHALNQESCILSGQRIYHPRQLYGKRIFDGIDVLFFRGVEYDNSLAVKAAAVDSEHKAK